MLGEVAQYVQCVGKYFKYDIGMERFQATKYQHDSSTSTGAFRRGLPSNLRRHDRVIPETILPPLWKMMS